MLLPPHKPEWPWYWYCNEEAKITRRCVYRMVMQSFAQISQLVTVVEQSQTCSPLSKRFLEKKKQLFQDPKHVMNIHWWWWWWWWCNRLVIPDWGYFFLLFVNFTENGRPHMSTIMIVHCHYYSNMMNVEVQNLSNWQCNFPLGVCYLDHAGATLYAESQIKAIAEDLCENVYGNPHSLSTTSRYSTDVIDQIRYRCVIILTLNFVRPPS